jgi:hypothetical protein
MSLRKDIDISKTSGNLGAYEKAFKQRVLRPALVRAMDKAAREAVAVLAKNTLDAPPAKPGGSNKGAVASGAFLKAWEIIPDRPSMEIAIINKRIYSPYVENGVGAGAKRLYLGKNERGHSFTLDMFEQWVRSRGLTSRYTRANTPRKLARMIMWRINKRTGVRFAPRNIIKKSTQKIRGIFQTCIRQEVEQLASRNLK